MSAMSASLPRIVPKKTWVRPAAIGLLTAMVLLLLGGNLAGNGALERSVAAQDMLLRWEQGSLLQGLIDWLAGWFIGVVDLRTALALIYITVAAVGAAALFRQLRTSDWPLVPAVLALLLVVSHPMLLQTVTTAGPEFLIVIATALLIPGRRGLEAVGDAQSVINYGLILPLLLMAGPSLAALIPFLLLAVPLSDPEARRRPRAFLAMLLVGIVPVLIIVLGVVVIAARSGIGPGALIAPFMRAFEAQQSSLMGPVALMALSAPVGFAVLLHALIPDRRRKVFTSAMVAVVPLYLAVGNSLFAFNLSPWLPAVALMAAALGWLAATRIRSWMHWLVLLLLLAGSAASWWLAPHWSQPGWLDGLMPIQLFGWQVG